MKNLSLVLNAILIIAVGFLYFKQFSGQGGTEADLNEGVARKSNLSIAYVNSDSLLKNYKFFEEISEQLAQKRTKLESELQNRAEGLQKEIEDFQRTAQNMTIGQARAIEEDLGQKQQNLRQYQEGLGQDLMREEAKLTNELYDKVSAYLKDYGNSKGLEIVLTYQKGSGVLYASDSLDITWEVVDGLNKIYDGVEEPIAAADSTATN